MQMQFNGLDLLLMVTLIAMIAYATKYWIIDGWLKKSKPRYKYYRFVRKGNLEDEYFDDRVKYRINLKTRDIEVLIAGTWEKSYFATFDEIERALHEGKIEEVERRVAEC